MREVEPLPNPVKFGAVSAGLGAIAISVLLIAAIEIGLRKTEGRALAARQDRSGAPGLGNLLPTITIHTPYTRSAWYYCWCESREGEMGYILGIMAAPWLAATGIYDPDVMKNGRCIAEPGSYAALYCPAPTAEAPKRRYRTKKYVRR
jgi:hypothetical protein